MKKDNEVSLDKISYTFIQEGNTLGTTELDETITINVEAPVGDIVEHGGFLVIRSETGWSIDNPKEFMNLLNLVKSGVKLK